MKINELKNHFNKEVTVQGFVENIRDLQWVQFVILRQGTTRVQITVEKSEEKNKDLVGLFSKLTNESTIKVTGVITESPAVKLNGMELIPSDVTVTSTSLEELPVDLRNKNKTLRDTRLDNRFLDLRRDEHNLLFKVATHMEHLMREYFLENDYMEMHSPKIASAAAESGAEVFKLDYFGKEATLSQSPQFYKQMAMASGWDKVFEIGPVFRAENSNSSFHATEIMMADLEIAWIESEEEVMDAEEAWLKQTLNGLNEKFGEDIKKTFKVDMTDVTADFPRITFDEAKKILKDNYKYESEKTFDFDRKDEKLLGKYIKQKYNSDFVFVTKYHKEARPFYHMLDENGLTKSFDLIYKGLEITTGAQREHRVDILEAQMIEKGVDPKELEFYLNFFRYGCPPHGGLGFGLARLLMLILNIDNIREVTYIYRGPSRLNP